MSEEDRRHERIDRTTYLVGSVEVLKNVVVRLLSELPAEQLEDTTAWLRECADEITDSGFSERPMAITVQEGYRGIAERAEVEVEKATTAVTDAYGAGPVVREPGCCSSVRHNKGVGKRLGGALPKGSGCRSRTASGCSRPSRRSSVDPSVLR